MVRTIAVKVSGMTATCHGPALSFSARANVTTTRADTPNTDGKLPAKAGWKRVE